MYLILIEEKEFEKVPRWITHPNKEAKGGLWSEPGAVAEAKLLMKRDCGVKIYKIEKEVEIHIGLEPKGK